MSRANTIAGLILALVSLTLALPAASADLDCAKFTKDAAQHASSSLREVGVPFTVDPARGIGFRISDADTARFNHL